MKMQHIKADIGKIKRAEEEGDYERAQSIKEDLTFVFIKYIAATGTSRQVQLAKAILECAKTPFDILKKRDSL